MVVEHPNPSGIVAFENGEEIREEYCPECPIVNATVDTVKEKLAWLIESPEERARLGREGREFVEKYCDRKAISRDLWNIYKSL